MANYVKFKQGLKKDFNTTNQPLTNGMIYFVIDENNHGSIYYDTVVDGAQATKKGTVHRVKFSGLPIKITGSVTGTGVISKDGETIEINTSTNHSHGLVHQDFTVNLSNDDTNLKWTRLGNQNGGGFWLKSIRGQLKAPAWFQPDYSAGIAFGGADTKGIISVKYSQPSVRFAGGNGDAPVWYFTITGANDKTYDLSKIGGHSSESAKLDHNVTFKILSTADARNGADGTKTDLSGAAVDIYLPTKISGFDLLQASRFQGNADSATYATSAGYAKGLFLNPETHQEDMNFNLADAKYIKRVTYSMATSTTKKNKPPIGDANILSFGWDNSGYGSQLAIQIGGAGHLAVRGSSSNNGASSWGDWSTVLDSSNYTSYINNYYWANVKVSTASSTETKPTFNTAYTSNWWRSTGNTGWWNETHSGGIAMEDNTYVKVAGNKSFLIPNGSLKIGGNGNILFATGSNDATFKIYGQNIKDYGTETIAIQTCFNNQDPQTSGYVTQYANRCNLLLQPRGGQVYIGVNLGTVGDTGYKLLVGGNQWINGNLVFNGAREIKFAGSKATFSMIRFIDNTSNTYGNGISIGGGGSTVIGAGESAMSFVTSGGDKRLFLLSDGSINVEAGGDTIANRKGFQVTGDGHVIPTKAENSNPNAQDLGSAADYWRNLYISNIILQGQIGNRLVWTNKDKILQAGYHYADTDRIAINTAGRQGFNFYVNGSSYFSSNTYIHRNYLLNNPSTGSGELVLTALGYKSAGYPVYNDPEFAKGANGISVYNNSANGVVTHAIISDTSSGNSSGKVLKITHTGTASPGLGGFRLGMQSRANAILIQIFRAKIPSGYNLSLHMNAIGNNTKYEWLTPNIGTGRWEWYANRMICGSTGTFNDGGYVAINLNNGTAAPTASSPLVWYLSYCNVIDVTKGNYDGLRTRYSDYVIYDSGEDGKDNKTPINDKYVAKIVTKTSNGTTFTLRGLNGAGNELTDAVLTIPNAGSGKAGLITDAAQTIYGEKTLTSNLRFANVSTGTRGIVGTIADNDCWRVVGRADKTDEGYLEIATGGGSNEPIYMRQYSRTFGTVTRTFTILDGSGRSRAPELFEAKKIHVNSKLNQNAAIADISYQFQVTGTSNFTDTVNISGVTNHHNNIQIDANYSIARPGKNSAWYGSHNNAMIRMTSVNDWSPLLAQKATNGYWILGHYNHHNEKNKNDDFRNQWVFGYLADSNLEGTTGASNSLSTTYRLLNIGGGSQRMFVSAAYNAAVGSGTQPVYVQSNGNVATCSYSLSATIEAGTANRMAYYKGTNEIAAAGHYVSSYQVGINATSVDEAYSFFVGGDSYFSGNVSALKKIYIGPNGVGGYLNGAATNGGCNSIMVGDDVWLGDINQSGIMGVKSTGSQAGFWFYNSGSTNIGKLYINSSKHLVIDNMLVNSASISVSGGGNYNYCKLATIKISSTYLNRPISFEIGGRGKQNSVISIMFSNTANSDPGLSYFTTNCENCFYIKKTATSTWEVYGNYSESWGTFLINRVYGEGLTVQGISVTWNMENISALPANSTRVSYGYHVNYADSASNADMVDGYHAARLWRSDGAIWDPNANVKLNASANNQEWSFDITRNGKTGCYWHVWDSTLSTMLKVNADDGKVSAPYNFVGKLEGVAKTLARSGDLNNAMTFNWSGQGGQPTWLWGGNDGVNMYVYNPSNFTVAKAGWLNKNTSLTYGANGLQYFDNYTDVTTGPTANANPEKDWYHIIRMNHANQGGYFVDLAICFHSDTFSYRRIVNGTDKGWVRLIDSSNISSQSVNYAASAGKLTTNAGSATKPIYFANGVPVQCNDTLGNNISGNAATATNADTTDGVHLEWSGSQAASATEWLAGWTSDGKKIKAIKRSDLETKNADTVDNYHAASFFIHDRLTATSTTGDDGLWGLTGSRSFHGALPEGLSNIYSYGQLISFSTDNSARLQIYAARTGSADSILSYRTGWGTDKKTWRTFIDSGNIGKQSVNYSNSTGYVRSLGNQAPETGRTAARGGVYTYNMYDQTANGAPGTYLSVVGFGNGTGGHIEIAGQWTGNSNLWMRGLRNCCDDWYSWNRIWCQGNSVTGAVWNDYAECRQSDCSEPGRVVFEKGDDTLTKTEKRLQHFAGVISDTWGFSQGETDKAKTNIAVAGRVLVYTYQDRNNYKPGDCVCAAPNGTIDIMTREEIIKFPDRIVGTVSCVPDYEEWGGGKNADRDPVKVNDRIWIKVK